MSQSLTMIRPGAKMSVKHRLSTAIAAAEHTVWPLLVIALVSVTVFHALTLMLTPAPFVDEGWLASRAWGLIHTGRNFGTFDAGVIDNFDGYWTYFPLIGTWIQSLAVRALGPNLFALRIVSLSFGLLLLGAVYTIGRSLHGPLVGLVAALLVSLSRAFFVSSHLGRQDVIVAALGFAAVALYVTDHSTRWSAKSVLSGLVVGLAFEVWPDGAIFGPTIAGLYLIECRATILRARRFWGFVIGVVVGLGVYAVLHVLQYPATYFTIARILFDTTHTPPIATLAPLTLLASLVEMSRFLGRFQLALVAVGIIVLVHRRSTSDLKVIGLFASVFVSTVALVANKMDYYEILISPASGLIVASALVYAFSAGSLSRPHRYVGGIALIGLIALSTIYYLRPLARDPLPDFRLVASRVQEDVAGTGTVMGPQTYWFALPERRYLSWEQAIYYRAFKPGSTLADAFAALHPDFLIIDANMDAVTANDPGALSTYGGLADYFRFFYVPQRDLDVFLAAHGQMIDSVDTITYGNVRVYRIVWPL